MQIAFQIAKTHLLSKKRQTLIAMLGVTFGIAMFIVMISFMQGVNQFLEDSALDASPHIRLYNDINTQRTSILDTQKPDGFNVVYHQKPKQQLPRLKNGLEMVRLIEKMPNVKGVSPEVSSQAFFNNGPIQISGIIAGIDYPRENKLYNLDSRIKSGSFTSLLSNPNGILLGNTLARKLNVRIGDKVSVTTPVGGNFTLRVVGIFGFGIGTIDNLRCYTSISTVQKMLGKDASYITDIHLKMNDPLQAIPFTQILRKQMGCDAEDWATANATILTGKKIRNVMTFVISMTLLVVAGFGIYNIMNMNVINKLKDIAILKATGFGGKDVVSVFLWQAVIIGLAGGLLGLLVGFLISYLLSITPFDAGEFLSIKTFPVLFKVEYYLMGLIFGVITTLLAGYFPSRKAARIDPVAILRG
ncbi:MAG: ABC transporter permease [Runella sp.]